MDREEYRTLSSVDFDDRKFDHLTPPIFRRSPKHIFIFALLSLSNLLFISLWLNASPSECIRPQLVYSPAKSVIRYEKKRLIRNIENNVYTGAPRPEHDHAWRRLIEPMTIRISRDELAKINETSIALRDGSGYIAETAVYHELHCIKRIRRHLYLDHYYPNMTEDERLREGPHIDHCLEYWREAAMCRGDTTLSTFRWADNKPFSTVYSDHECVNWELLDTWARGKMVDMSDWSIIVPASRR
ncbi:uncharacterized protein BDZ99DRAFT_136906 [Mytilinidion resinicola]|uniref:Uncharacterized protein n=1 Tax=Mytilinidion resinicola TaxID=574789 RepID=A0A6A6Z620_9PEZI|nr:uncharacterized protein BDZ99DRAFT_136906 [Mytilinidion resinicola]KAF2816480.1 hypothetical protein BDZ99DRAFT_136906 [Mytilinidion resinicola]